MDYEYRAAKTPLIDLLRKVPKDGRHMYEHNPTHHQNIPYGRLCHEAADELEAWNRRELSGNSEQVEPVVDHIEDVRGRSMADAAVGKCDCDPHIEYCPSCAPYLHEPLKPAGEEDKATYKQIADNYTSPANCPRCAELELQNSILEKELSQQANRIKELETKLTLFVSRG